HEYVYRKVREQGSAFKDKHNVWLLTPARLISGMSFVGQWENRLLAILKEARRREHILYFDDVLGLFQAGHTGNSTLSVAGVLKPYLERRDVRVLAEMTPEAFRVLREQDRGFADLFHLLPLREPREQETRRILLSVQRQLEGQHRCRFDLDVLPTVLDLVRRYGGGTAFPGKAASLLRQLAVRHHGAEVTRLNTLEEFHVRSGLAVTFLDRQARLDREEILQSMSRQVIGQDAALHAAADVIGIAKARLNDPDRPLAAFLFLGPTGVGKTHCAKAIAAYLFGDADRLVRFDLNEYAEPGSVTRLVGTFRQPEGLLTSAIRRQPFAVVLFDEVEKAHPEVFDVLLQVLGEGRLTDALGRTADFTNALIILTSNLGVREAESGLGFRLDDAARELHFVQAAERFFRPEFFNRLDRILPFQRLQRDHVRRIARLLIQDVLAREGLVQRKCILAVEERALERIVDAGYDPLLGARALKRAVERQLTQPLAVQLSALPPGVFTTVRVYPGRGQLAVHVQALEQAKPVTQPALNFDNAEDLLHRVRAVVRRIEDDFAALRPAGPITLGRVRPEEYRYFALREQIEEVREGVRHLQDKLDAARRSRRALPAYRKPDSLRRNVYSAAHKVDGNLARLILREMAAALDINEYLRSLAEQVGPAASGAHDQELTALLQRCAVLQAAADCQRTGAVERVVFWPRGLIAEHQGSANYLRITYRAVFSRLGLDVSDFPDRDQTSGELGGFLLLQGPHAWALTCLEAGTHLFCPAHAPVQPIQVEVLPLADEENPAATLSAWRVRRQNWLERLERGEATVQDDPLQPGAVVRVYSEPSSGMVDLRTGQAGVKDLGACLLAALPLPQEITASV
ncbi:MAG TPA: AAA family ATPase, partial [Gemmataceae bacterium]|nr:AAA family ATPase [Gemmataceae bacterium]